MWSIIVLVVLSIFAYLVTDELIPKLKELFIKAGLYGIDLCKTSKNKIPEAVGVVSGCVFLVTCFIFIPIVFGNGLMEREIFPHNEFAELLAALLSICCMLLLGFADDVLDLRWRYKLLLPTVASLPLLVVYYVNFNSTTFVIPIPLRQWLGSSINIASKTNDSDLLDVKQNQILDARTASGAGFCLNSLFHLAYPQVASFSLRRRVLMTEGRNTLFKGPVVGRMKYKWEELNFLVVQQSCLYYIYMGMLAVFCTNAINILAGINGLEVGQSVIIAISIIIFDIIELAGDQYKAHMFSLHIMIPYLATALALLKHNWYPSKVFVGDTFCYVSGMTFAVVGILSHFSKTVLLFFLPQIINFIYSVPQLFHLIPCPRHRLPKYSAETDLLHASKTIIIKKEMNFLNKAIIHILTILHLVDKVEDDDSIVMNNMTLINLFLIKLGPTSEIRLSKNLIAFQCFCSFVAFLIRYPMASYFYDT